MKKTISFLSLAMTFSVLIMSLSGCAPRSTGVLLMGQDTYLISVSDPGDKEEARKTAYNEAKQECTNQGKELSILSEKKVRFATIDLTFKCLDKNDPEINKQPVNEKAPEVLKEGQSK